MNTNLQEIRFGFWYRQKNPHLPVPLSSIFDNEEICNRLLKIQGMVGKQNTNVTHQVFDSPAVCKICEKSLEHSDYRFQFANRLYVWPGSLHHYLLEHHIEPPQPLRDMVGYHEFKWKLKRENAKMGLFPFNVIRGLGHIFETVKPPDVKEYTLCGAVLSPTQVRLIATDSNHNIIYDQTLTVEKEQLAEIIYDRKFWVAEQEYRERVHARRKFDIEAVMKEIFGE